MISRNLPQLITEQSSGRSLDGFKSWSGGSGWGQRRNSFSWW